MHAIEFYLHSFFFSLVMFGHSVVVPSALRRSCFKKVPTSMLNLIFIFVTDFSVISFGCFYEVVLLALLIFKKKIIDFYVLHDCLVAVDVCLFVR